MTNLEIPQLYELYISSTGVCTDTRSIKEGCMFFALKGETFNGNDFARQALLQGAKYVVVDDPQVYGRWEESRVPKMELKSAQQQGEVPQQDKTPETVVNEAAVGPVDPQMVEVSAMILVENVLETIQQLARYHRLRFKIPVIALTGTNGKTTTKELITAALSAKYNVVSTIGNLNNHIGVPLSLFNINSETQIAVIEMGASAPGEIQTLVKLVCPSFGMITNVGKAHLLGFGSFEGVKKTKGELYDNLVEYRKIAFVNMDNPHLMEMVSQRPTMQIVPYGIHNDGVRIIKDKEGSPFLKLIIPNPCAIAVCENINSEISEQIARENGITRECCEPAQIEINTHLIGDYNADNVIAALCISTYFAVPTKDAIRALEAYVPSNNRSQMTKTEHNTLIIDAYNANPTSMRASLENFAGLNLTNKMLILGDMRELGADSLAEHIEIIKLALSMDIQQIYLVGAEFAKAYEQLSGTKESTGALKGKVIIELFEDSLKLRERLSQAAPVSASILIKGSNGIKLGRIFDVL